MRFKLYRQLDDIPLSDALPMMENMGLAGDLRASVQGRGRGGRLAYIQDFEVESLQGDLDVDAIDANFEEAFARVWRGEAENDGFNRLILAAGLSWRQVAMLRSYCKYLLQVGVPFSQSYVEATLARYPLLARLLVELFEARFDPRTGCESDAEIRRGMSRFGSQLKALTADDEAAMAALQSVIGARSGKREQQVEATRATLLGLMDRVASLDDDRILRSFIGGHRRHLAHQLLHRPQGRPAQGRRPGRLRQLQARFVARCRTCRSRARIARSGSAARAWRASTCASGRSRVAACAGRTGARISAPRCWAWSRRRW